MKPILTLFSSLLMVCPGFAKDKPPNVITLLVDDLGYRDIGCYGGPVKTPVLDKLAAGGVRFTDFHSGAPSCSPSRATFLTGRNHRRTGVYSVITERLHKMHLLKSETTIAKVLKENGYATAHFGKWHLGMPVQNRENPTPGDHGFDYWFGLVNGPGPSHKNPTNFLRNGKRVGPMKGYSCQIVVDEALTWLDEKRDAGEPFFLNLWFNEPHAPIAAPDEIVSQYGALDDQAAIYSGTIDNTDRAIGRLVAKLEKLGELDNTIIVYSSDNGSYRQERNGALRGKKGALFEGGHRVPGIIYWKGGIPGGRVEDEPAGAVDLLPTLCGLIGIERPVDVHLDGSDLAPLLTRSGNFERHQPLFWMSEGNMVMRVGDHTLFASVTAKSPIDFKTADRLTEQIKEVLGDDLEKVLDGMDLRSRLFNNGRLANPEADRLRNQLRDLYYFDEAWIPELKKSGIGRVQLYDLSKDLGQQNDIAKERPELVARMKKHAAAIHRSVMAEAPEWLTPEEQAAAKKPQEDTPDRPATGASDTDTAKLLARIDKNNLPEGYQGNRHQPYVDRVMAGLKPEQRARVGQLWKEKRRLDSDMPNPGASFVRILTHVARETGKSKQPNVVILLADDLGSKDLGCYGGPVKTPVLDGLAARGVRFTDFHAGAAICSPSRATLITGRQHLRTGIYGVLQDHMHNMHLLEREVTIPELLQQAGYGTAHFGKWHIGMTSGERKKPSPTEHGFDYWFGLSNGAHPSHKDPVNFLRNGKRVGPLKGYSCHLIVDDAIRWLEQKESPDQPFLLNLWFNEPHHKLAAPDEIVSIYGDLKDEAAIYSATVDNTDRAIGRLVAKLKTMGQLNNTLIIYSSDHGSYRTDRNGELKGNKGSNFQGGLRSPGIFFWPDGIRGGRIEDRASGSVDLLPTICGLIGIDKPKGVHLDGADLSPLLTEKGTFQRDQPLFWLAPSSGHLATLREGSYTLMGYRGYQLPSDRVRYNDIVRRMAELSGIDPSVPNLGQRVSNTTFSSPEFNRLNAERVRLQTFQEGWIPTIKAGGFSGFALYDLSSDPQQQNDISKQRPKVTERLKQKLLALYKDVMADAPDWGQKPKETTPSNPSSSGVSPEDRELTDLLTRIDQMELPDGYDVTNHQPWVDRRMEALKPEQRGRVGRLWKEKRRLQPKMKNAGMSFVRILEYVARGETLTANSAPRPAAPLPQRKSKPVVSKIDPKGIHWHQWRGPEANGVSRTAKPPLEWSEDRNIKWKVAIGGQGNASPIVWGDRVFVLTAIDTGRVDPSLPKPEDQPKRVFGIKHPNTFYKFEVLCLDRQTGKELWRQTASEHVPHEGTHHDADFASASPTTDGERLYCWFGSAGMYCYDLNGKKLWQRDLGKAYVGASLGEGCSPVVYKGKVVIVRDHARQSSIEVLDARTGKTSWKKDRDEPNAWATPRVVEHSGKTQVITAASNWIRSYDLDSGEIIWQCSGLTGNVTPSPIVDGDVVYCMSGYEGYSLLALPLDARGDISNSDKIIWSKDRGTPYVPSPVLYEGMLYFTQSNQAILTAVNSRSGDSVFDRTRLSGLSNLYSSPVGADGRLYFTGRNGTTVVLRQSNKVEILATNKLDDEFNASPAMAGRQLFLRGRKSLYCLENRTGDGDTGKQTSIEGKTRIHRLATTRRSTFDAFSYINRIPEKPYDDETAEDFTGRIFGRLANQEGRVLLKTPAGMDRLAYDGFKTFLSYEGTASVGNCAACHAPANFTDGKSHVVSKGGTAKLTPSLRNLSKRQVDLRKILIQKLEASQQKRSGKADDFSDAYAAMKLSERDIPGLTAFLNVLEDVPEERFRKLILEAMVLDTSEESDEP